VINSAYRYFVKKNLQPDDVVLTKKADRITALKIAFLLEPPEFVIEEEEDPEDENSDDEYDA
jgi:hypothetical protein